MLQPMRVNGTKTVTVDNTTGTTGVAMPGSGSQYFLYNSSDSVEVSYKIGRSTESLDAGNNTDGRRIRVGPKQAVGFSFTSPEHNTFFLYAASSIEVDIGTGEGL